MSSRTIKARVDLVYMFGRLADVNPMTTSWEPLAEFLSAKRFQPGTRQTYLANLRTWFHWLVLMDLRIDDPTLKLHKGKPVHRKPRPVTVLQLSRLLATPMHKRTRAMILLGAYEGFRVSEMAKFAAEDIDGDVVQVVGKGGIFAELPLHPLVAEAAEWMPKTGYWFSSYVLEGPLLANSVSTIVGDVMRRAEVRRTPHALRHFFGTQCLKASGGNLVVTQQLMRHINISSTAGYTDVDESERRATILALPMPSTLRSVA